MAIGSRPSQTAADGTIFVVETDDVVRSALQFILRDGNDTRSFAGLDEALSETSDRRPDGVLLGLSLIRDGGDRIFSELVARVPEVKVLLIADSASDPWAQGWIGRGAHDVLGKPITVDAVRRKVDLLLGRGPAPGPRLPAGAVPRRDATSSRDIKTASRGQA